LDATCATVVEWLYGCSRSHLPMAVQYNFEDGPAISPIFLSFLLALLVSSVATLIGL
jgi:ABC-type amino acid transport system permease subunit